METTRSAQTVALNPRRAPKSRGGCLRCKAKRLKCDETKPECSQCSRRHVQCPGFKTKSLVWSTKHEKLLRPPTTTPSSSPANALARDPEESSGSSKEKNGVLGGDEPTAVQEEQTMGAASSPSSQSSPLSTRSRRDSGAFTDSLSAIRQQLHRSTVPEFLLHLPTMLVEYYFNYVCQIFSSFDGTLNPFRSTVGKLWDGSAPIYYAIQSMAAAYLANHFPRMSPVGIQMQRETYKCLYQAQHGRGELAENLDKTLLSVLLFGQTTAWHNPKDLGLMHLRTAKRLNRRRLEQQVGQIEGRAQRQNEFFEQCILYWDMLAGFVEDDVDEFGFGHEMETYTTPASPAATSSVEEGKVFPHPWTGVAPKVQRLFAQVGRVIRRYRKACAQNASSMNFIPLDLGFDMQFPQDSIAMIEALSSAQALEEQLLSFEPPSSSSLVDAGDENTPVQQYILLAEAYRSAALLEIYRVFPSILFKRVPLTENTFPPSSPGLYPPQQTFDFLSIPNSQSPDDFVISLAMHTVSLLEKLPPTSGTRCLQPIVVIAAGSELRFASASMPDLLSSFAPAASSSIFNSITNREVDVAAARQFVMTRLQEFQISLPAKPIVKALQLIQETWARADLGQEVFWMDVMEECGWESIFG